MISSAEFVKRLIEIPQKYKTYYATGTFGQRATDSVINAKANQYPKQYTAAKIAKLKALPDDTRLFDCCGLIKAVLWNFPNTVYTSNGVSDLSDAGLYNVCTEKTTDLKKVPVGGLLHMTGHVGIKISETQAIDCSTKWNCVKIHDLFTRGWKEGGKLPYIQYSEATPAPAPAPSQKETPTTTTYTVKSGDTLSGIGAKLKMDWKKIAELNGIKSPYTIYIGQKLKLTGTSAPAPAPEIYYTVKKGDTMSKIASANKTTLTELKKLNPQIKNVNLISVGQKVRIK